MKTGAHAHPKAHPKAATAPPGDRGLVLLMVRLARMGGYRLTEALAAMEMRTHEFAVLNQLSEAAPLSQQDLGRALQIGRASCRERV